MHLGIFFLFALALLDLLVDAVLEENLGQRLGVEQVLLLGEVDFQFALQVFQQLVGVAAQHFGDAHLHRAVFTDHGHIHRDRHRTVGVHVKPLHRLFRIVAAGRHHLDFHLVGGVVIHARNLDFVLFGGFFDRCDQCFGGGGRRNFTDDQVAADDFDLRAQRDLAVAVVVLAHIHQPALLEIGIKLELLSPQHRDFGFEQLVEVVRHDLGRHADRDAVAAQHQQRRDLRRQRYRLHAAPVVGVDELGDVVVEQHLMAERRKAALDVTPRRSRAAGQDVAEIALPGDVILLVGQHHQRILDRSVAVRMIVHGVADHVRDLVGASVVDLIERPEHTALHRLQSVVHIGNRAVLDHIAGVFKEVPVHHGPEIVVIAAVALGGNAVRIAVFRRIVVFGNDFGVERNRRVQFVLFRFVTHICALPGCS